MDLLRSQGTDRGAPPLGNTLNSTSVSHPFISHLSVPIPTSSSSDSTNQPKTASKSYILASHFSETIGLTADFENGKMYIADLGGNLWMVDLNETDEKTGEKRKEAILREAGNFTGVVLQKGKK